VLAAESPTVEVDGTLLEDRLSATQRTHVLGAGEGTVPQFDSSDDATAARRAERRGALTRPGKKGRSGARVLWLALGAMAGAVALAGLAWAFVSRGTAPGKEAVSAARPAPAEAALARAEPPARAEAPGLEPPARAEAPDPEPQQPDRVASDEAPAPAAAPRAQVAAPAGRPETKGPPPPEQRSAPRRRSPQAARLLAANAPMVVPTDASAGGPAATGAAAQVAAREAPPFAGDSEVAEHGARLHVRTEPIGAEIRLGGRSIGRAPLTTGLLQPDRDYDLSASLEGYVSVSRVVRPGNGLSDVTLLLPVQPIAGAAVERAEPQPALASVSTGYLVTNTRPAARVSIDGRETGRWTPVPEANPIALPSGAHTVVFETADGKRLEETLQIEPGKTTRLVREIPPN
jgi:PEGA domain